MFKQLQDFLGSAMQGAKLGMKPAPQPSQTPGDALKPLKDAKAQYDKLGNAL